MARARAALAILVLAVLAPACLGAAANADTPGVTPRPLSVESAAGAPVRLPPGAGIAVTPGDAAARWTATYLQSLTMKSRGLRLALGGGAPRIRLMRGGPDLGPEGYSLAIAHGQARITARTDAGLFYGAVTLWRLMTADGASGAVTLAPTTIVDRPRFAWRGLLLDSARHYQSPAFIAQLIDRMARLKLNRLQWHLTDDQGWRIEIKRYPRLTSVGAWRAGVDPKTGRPIRYGGFYSQATIRRIVAYAAARQVTIVPEIEMPGHSLSAILAYPKLGVAPADGKTQGDWGVFPAILDPDADTLAVMDGVLSEVMSLFPSRWIGVGGDEAVKDQWRASPKVQAQIRRLGLTDEEALQGWFTGQIGQFLATHGRRLMGWDDMLKGGAAIPADAQVASWHLEGASQAIATGHDTVIATDPTLYFDHRQGAFVGEPPGRQAVISLADVYGLDPAPPSLPAAALDHIVGVQGALWSEHMPTEADMARMAFPRADAVAEVGWTAAERKSWPDFAARVPAERARDRALGLVFDDEAALAADEARESAAHPDRRMSQQLPLCTQKLPLNLAAPLAAQGGPYMVDIMNPCWTWPQADLGAAREIRVAVTRLPFNFQLGADAAKIPLAPPTTPAGELVIRADGCAASPPTSSTAAGAPIASVPLSLAAARSGVTVLSASLPAMAGRHDLCLSFTRRTLDPMWVVDWAEMTP